MVFSFRGKLESSTILPTSAKWSSGSNPLFLQAIFARSMRHCEYPSTFERLGNRRSE
nr:MAG TPA: FILAMIN A, INTEGRIN BETA-7 SUBUNIT PROTEIN, CYTOSKELETON-COMPLEX, ACTIN-BINDING, CYTOSKELETON [Bacteriophage sp.]